MDQSYYRPSCGMSVKPHIWCKQHGMPDSKIQGDVILLHKSRPRRIDKRKSIATDVKTTANKQSQTTGGGAKSKVSVKEPPQMVEGECQTGDRGMEIMYGPKPVMMNFQWMEPDGRFRHFITGDEKSIQVTPLEIDGYKEHLGKIVGKTVDLIVEQGLKELEYPEDFEARASKKKTNCKGGEVPEEESTSTTTTENTSLTLEEEMAQEEDAERRVSAALFAAGEMSNLPSQVLSSMNDASESIDAGPSDVASVEEESEGEEADPNDANDDNDDQLASAVESDVKASGSGDVDEELPSAVESDVKASESGDVNEELPSAVQSEVKEAESADVNDDADAGSDHDQEE